MALVAELKSLIEDRRGAVHAAYLDAVTRTASGERLDPAETLGVLEAVGVTPAQFDADVVRQKLRREAETTIAQKADWQSALAALEAERGDLARRQSVEMNELTARHSAKMVGVRVRIEGVRQALADVKAAEQLLLDSEGVSALDPNPVRLEYGTIQNVDFTRGLVVVSADLGWPRLHDVWSRELGLPLAYDLVNRRVSFVRDRDAERGWLLRNIALIDSEAPAMAG